LAINLTIYTIDKTILGTFEIALLHIQFSKNNSGICPELKAQSKKLNP